MSEEITYRELLLIQNSTHPAMEAVSDSLMKWAKAGGLQRATFYPKESDGTSWIVTVQKMSDERV